MDQLTRENLIRKKIARNPEKIEDWATLFILLLSQLNFKEVDSMVRVSLGLNPTNNSIKLLCMNALMRSLNFNACLSLIADGNFFNFFRKDRASVSNLYYLDLIGRSTRKFTIDLKDLECSDKKIEDYNRWIFSESDKCEIDLVFYLAKPFHYQIQIRIALLVKAAGYKCIFTEHLWVAVSLKPRIIVTSEAFQQFLPLLRFKLPNTIIVNTRHGLADKNYLAIGASNTDRVCVSSDSVATFFKEQLLIDDSKIWVTGFPLLDDLFLGISKNKSKNHTILFAPTFNPGLGCLDLVKGKCLSNLIRGSDSNLRIIIRPHPSTENYYPELIKQWDYESRNFPNIILLKDSILDITTIFNESDLMISDFSSIALSWMVTSKPLILFYDERQSCKSERFAEDGIEHQIKTAATIVNDPNKLESEVLHALSNPNERHQEIERYANLLFGNLRDGKAAERIAHNILGLLKIPFNIG